MNDKLFGYLGIDTSYERKLVYYRPLIKALRGVGGASSISEGDKDIKVLRVEEFTITKAISAYRTLIERIEGILEDIRKREDPVLFERVRTLYDDGKFQELLALDSYSDKVNTRCYVDFHYMCRLMLTSLNSRLVEVINKFGTQFTEDKSDDAIAEAEALSIEEMNVLYQTLKNLEPTVNEITNGIDDHGPSHDDDEIPTTSSNYEITYQQTLRDVNDLINEKNRFHQSIADLSMIHQNRCAMINEMCDIISVMINHLFNLYNEDIEDAIHLFHENNGSSIMMVAATTNFSSIKTKQIQQKAKLFEYQERIESFAFDKQFFYQQMEQNYNNNAINLSSNLLYNDNPTVKRVNSLVISSIEENKHSYNKTIKDMLNYYKQEAEAFKNTLDLAIDKEEVRLFYLIGESLKNVHTINVEWMENFFEKMKTY